MMCPWVCFSLQADQSELSILEYFFLDIFADLAISISDMYGNIIKEIVLEGVLVFLTGLLCLLEVTMSESWIAKARNEAQSLKVPSCLELAIITGNDQNAEGADCRSKADVEVDGRKENFLEKGNYNLGAVWYQCACKRIDKFTI